MHDLITAYVSKDSVLLLFNVINANILTDFFYIYTCSHFMEMFVCLLFHNLVLLSMNGKCNKMLSLYHTFKPVIYLLVPHGKVT